ncbi:hypothetical protein GGQ97_000872 [Sphingomonas kaistensis]|uniref:DUF3617 family protein n=1 Tax=Sphingomonas kaistensis TaxID=298708 RepID=A0A7X6BF68_9SPHN|nr:DUF3617 family protein [Sphingomonas kaistensis]NJC05079.1 hypothetical protein [Sphingomonas kaistensis]
MRHIVLLGTVLLAACSQEAPKEAAKAAPPATLVPGTYEVTATVKSLVSADKTPLPTFAKVGDVITTRGCVGADGLPAAELLAAKGDTCQVQNPYIRSGRMNLTLDCNRKGQGQVMTMVDGKYDAEGFTGTVNASSSFPGPGDYKLVQEVTARKVADQCTAEPAAGGAPKA